MFKDKEINYKFKLILMSITYGLFLQIFYISYLNNDK